MTLVCDGGNSTLPQINLTSTEGTTSPFIGKMTIKNEHIRSIYIYYSYPFKILAAKLLYNILDVSAPLYKRTIVSG